MQRPQREETANWVTHGLGIVLSLFAAGFMISQLGNASLTLVISCIAYLLALIGVYTCSTLSHWYTADFRDGEPQRRFRILDQAFIYLLIVASYTPFSVAYLQATWWWCVLGLMWAIAIGGFVSKIFFAHRVNQVSIWIYIALGWIPALSGMPFNQNVPADVLWNIVAGGLLYTGGTLFLFNDRKQWYFHAIWHIFVIGGSAVHFWGILQYAIWQQP